MKHSPLFRKHSNSKTIIVEAPGVDKVSRSVSSGAVKVDKGAVKQKILTESFACRGLAASRAYENLRGRNFNSNFAFKDVNGKDLNCSQLVWVAHKKVGGRDLDGNGGLGVYPYDIRNSKYTETYATL